MPDEVSDKKQILKKVHQLRLDCVPNVMREKVVELNESERPDIIQNCNKKVLFTQSFYHNS